ncbi:MAG: Permease of the drug/metabolite transporter (DMT) superfamily [Anaerolineae bacterium]|nr:MAG: Permease of the drug/metabolite transporter (DMT) superfamily [Anaerolineae bacterium]
MNDASSRPPFPPGVAFVFGILAVSSGSILARYALAYASPLVVSAYRLSIATLILLPVVLLRHRSQILALRGKALILTILAGIFLAFHFATWISSLMYTTVASSVVLVSTAPLWVALLAPLLLRESIRKGTVVGMLLALGGTILVGISESCRWEVGGLRCPAWGEFFGAQALWGDFLALVGGFLAACYLLLGRSLRAHQSLFTYIFSVYGVAALVLLGWVAVTELPLLSYPRPAFGWFLALAIVPQLLGHSTFNWALRYVPTALVSIALLGEPLGSTLLAYLFLNETPDGLQLIGGALILSGLVIASLYQKENLG